MPELPKNPNMKKKIMAPLKKKKRKEETNVEILNT